MDPESLALLERRVPRYTSYPTAPHFTRAIGESAYRGWLAALPAGEPISLYIHVPFCAALCWYCGCNTRVVRGDAPIAQYLDQIEAEAALVRAALPAPPAVAHLHLGGGTPNQLAPDRLERLWRIVETRFAIDPGAEISVELDPRHLSDAQIACLAALGVNRASLGVQDFDPAVQRAINRVQPIELVAAAVARLRAAGIAAINFDLIYGLPLQTVESVARTARAAAALAPDRISLFGYAHVPWMKKHQAQIPEASLPGLAERAAQEEAAARTLEKLGYVRIGLDHFARPDDALALRQKEGRLHRNFQGYTTDECRTLIGLGPSSIGSFAAGYVQNHGDPVAYRRALAEGKLPIDRGVAIDADDRFRRAIIERLMCDLAVDLAALGRDFGADPDTLDLAPIDALAAAGLCRREGYRVTVPESHRKLVRLVCARFDRHLDPARTRHSLAV